MGDNPESRGVAREAGEVQKELTLLSDIIQKYSKKKKKLVIHFP